MEKKEKILSVRVTDEFYEKLKQYAASSERNLNGMVRYLIAKGIENEGLEQADRTESTKASIKQIEEII